MCSNIDPMRFICKVIDERLVDLCPAGKDPCEGEPRGGAVPDLGLRARRPPHLPRHPRLLPRHHRQGE